LLVALLALAICATFAANASAGTSSAKAKGKVSLKVKSDSQKQILKKGIEVKVKGKKPKKGKKGKKVTLKAESKTFDSPQFSKLAKQETVRLNKKGKATATLELTGKGEKAVATCQGRTVKVSTSGAKATFKLTRDTADCKPQEIDMSRADECDFIGDQTEGQCLLPFPDDFYTKADSSSSTGRRVDLKTSAMPANASQVPMDAAPYNAAEGFSPGQAIVVKAPGMDTQEAAAATGAVPLSDLGAYQDADAPIVVIDATTGERWPIWVEVDSNADTAEETAVLIHPAVNFASGHRYIVAMRNLKDSGGNTLSAPQGFRYYRDDLPSSEPEINGQRDRFDSIFDTLRDADIERSNLYLAWDFTVNSDANISQYTLSMRNQAFEDLGDTNLGDGTVQGDAPNFTVTSVTDYEPTDVSPLPEDSNMARKVEGTFQVPCYMTTPSGGQPCDPGARLNLDSNGVPQQNGTYTANFTCMIPYAALNDPARASVYGHGLLGDAGEATSGPQKSLGNTYNLVDCATDEIGMAEADVPNTIQILLNMGRFPQLAERLQQGLINGLYLGRLLDNNDGFVTDEAFTVDGDDSVNTDDNPVIDTSKLYYNGNSQGAIFGGAWMALSPDATRGSLGVGGMNYSVLLNRSVDFDTYATFLDPAYPDELTQQLVLSMVQMLWDRGETNGYAHRITTSPLPDTPQHKLLMNIAVGDHQVSNYTAETMARTIGASIHTPIVYDGRWPGVDYGWNIPAIGSFPFTGSALVYWDGGPTTFAGGTDPDPIPNIPNRVGSDPHSYPRNTAAEQQMVSEFLRPDNVSSISDTCAGAPCYSHGFTGP
jgi:hypothetical protein